MKYLKSFNESYIEWSDILQNIKDICLELEDNGFIISYNTSSKYYSLIITIHKSSKFKYTDVKDVVERLRYYLPRLPRHTSKVNLEGHPKINLSEDILYQTMSILIEVDRDRSRVFNEGSSNSWCKMHVVNILNDLHDICLELEDDGYEVFVYKNRLKIDKQSSYINYSDIEDVINRIKDYLGNKFISIEGIFVDKYGWDERKDITEDKSRELEIRTVGTRSIRINYNLEKKPNDFFNEGLERFNVTKNNWVGNFVPLRSKSDIEEQKGKETSLIVKDICIELEDKGFNMEFQYSRKIQRTYDEISPIFEHKGVLIITKLDNSGSEMVYKVEEIEEALDRIKDYLGKRWIREEGIYYDDNADDDDDSTGLSEVIIEFKNV